MDPSVGRSRVRENAAPAAMPLPTLRPERRCSGLYLWATPVHASWMVESTADDHLAVDGDANVCAGAMPKVSAMSLEVMDTGSRLKDASAVCLCGRVLHLMPNSMR